MVKVAKSNKMTVWAIFIVLFITEMLVYTWCRLQCVGVGYSIREYEQQRSELINLRNEFVIEQARLKSPERIIRIANQQLYLIFPTPEQIKIIQ